MIRPDRVPIAFLAIATEATLLLVLASAEAQDTDRAREGFSPVQDLQVVDCLLPGQVRVLGGRTYLTPRRPTRTTAEDCAARGGEYLAYDRANYRAALNVWLPAAEEGDAGAQTTVGEIYERGLGGEPNYVEAAQWYRRAAAQGNSRAQFNLGTLYEQGLGVSQNRLEALNLFRLASGLSEDSLIYRSAAAAEQQELRSTLLRQIEQRDRQIEVLNRQIESLNERLRDSVGDTADARAELDSVRALFERLELERNADREVLAAMPTVNAVAPADIRSFEQPERVRYDRRDFGRFYALLIGVQDYDLLDDLTSPANDVTQLGRLLEERYGFSVVTLADPDQLSVMRAINQLNDSLEENDNLLIYFSGHGSRLQGAYRETGYWLPRNAEPAPDDTLWIPNEFVSRHLGRIDAQRILIISDSCYAGMLGDEPGYVMIGNGRYTDEYIDWKIPKRSRLVLSSGLDSPVVGGADENHSIFAQALLEELRTNEQVLTAPELFLRVRQRIRRAATDYGPLEDPELKALKDAGHEVGDFFLIPART